MRGISVILAAALPAAVACSTPKSRIRRSPEKFASYPPDVREKIRAGQVDIGFDPDMVYMALGKPRQRFTRTTREGVFETWVYGRGGGRPGVGFSIGGATGGGGGIYGGGVSVGSGGGYYADEMRVVFQGGRVVAVETASGP